MTDESNFNADRGQALIGVIVAEEESVFGASGEHSVRIVNAFGYEVVDHDADKAVVAGEYDFRLIGRKSCSVDTRDDALAGGFFISRGTVDLSGEEESRQQLGHEGWSELEGVSHVVFNGIAGSHHVDIFETRNGFEGGELNVAGHGAAKALDIYGLIIPHFLFEENGVRILFSESNDFVFDAGAVTRADAFDLSAEHGGLMKIVAKNLVSFAVGMGLPSGQKLLRFERVVVKKTHGASFGF